MSTGTQNVIGPSLGLQHLGHSLYCFSLLYIALTTLCMFHRNKDQHRSSKIYDVWFCISLKFCIFVIFV